MNMKIKAEMLPEAKEHPRLPENLQSHTWFPRFYISQYLKTLNINNLLLASNMNLWYNYFVWGTQAKKAHLSSAKADHQDYSKSGPFFDIVIYFFFKQDRL